MLDVFPRFLNIVGQVHALHLSLELLHNDQQRLPLVLCCSLLKQHGCLAQSAVAGWMSRVGLRRRIACSAPLNHTLSFFLFCLTNCLPAERPALRVAS